MWNIFKKEFKSFFNTPTGYIIVGLFLFSISLFLWVIPGEYNVLDNGYANLDGLFYMAPWFFLFLCPAITMRLFAEEKQQGTIELLLTRPIKRINIVLGKFFAGWVLVVVALLPTLIWYVSVNFLAEPFGNVDSGAFWGAFIGLILLAAVYTSVGLFASSISSNQLVSFVLAVVACFTLFYGFELVGSLFSNGDTAYAVQSVGINAHYKSMCRGVIYSRDLVYMIGISALFIFLTQCVIAPKRK